MNCWHDLQVWRSWTLAQSSSAYALILAFAFIFAFIFALALISVIAFVTIGNDNLFATEDIALNAIALRVCVDEPDAEICLLRQPITR